MARAPSQMDILIPGLTGLVGLVDTSPSVRALFRAGPSRVSSVSGSIRTRNQRAVWEVTSARTSGSVVGTILLYQKSDNGDRLVERREFYEKTVDTALQAIATCLSMMEIIGTDEEKSGPSERRVFETDDEIEDSL